MKILQINLTNSAGNAVSTVWVGNEYAKDPSEVLQIINITYGNDSVLTNSDVTIKCQQPTNQFLNDKIQRIMLKAGYEWIVPKTITLK